MDVLGISGSLRRGSHNTELLRAAASLLPSRVGFELFDGLGEILPFNEDLERSAPQPVQRLRAEIAAADAILIATPEYNHSIPGHLKNALDWVSRPHYTNTLRGKPVAVMGASTGLFGAVWAQAELRKVLSAIGARVVDRELPVPTADEIVHDREQLVASGVHSLMAGLLDELTDLARERDAIAA
jgi:chromate reductase, NAD(P)H dehydrogenase (quinone)